MSLEWCRCRRRAPGGNLTHIPRLRIPGLGYTSRGDNRQMPGGCNTPTGRAFALNRLMSGHTQATPFLGLRTERPRANLVRSVANRYKSKPLAFMVCGLFFLSVSMRGPTGSSLNNFKKTRFFEPRKCVANRPFSQSRLIPRNIDDGESMRTH